MRSLGVMTSNSINRGLAAMPAQERSLRVDARRGGDQSHNQGQHREAMARNTSPQGSSSRADDVQLSQQDDAGWDQDHDEAAGYRARRLLSGSNSGFHRSEEHTSELQLL